jgi:porin
MIRKSLMVAAGMLVLLGSVRAGWAQEGGAAQPPPKEEPTRVKTVLRTMQEGPTLTNNWFGLGQELAKHGLTVGLDLTQVYQMNLQGGLATHKHSGRWVGRYNLEVDYDLGVPVGLKGGSVHASAVGHWSPGLNPRSVGSLTDVNAVATPLGLGDEAVILEQLYYQQLLLERKLLVRVGKFALGMFDRNDFAEDPTTQFLNAALFVNPTIPLPEAGMGVLVDVAPTGWSYVTVAVVDSDSDRRETGFRTAFHGEESVFSILESGVMYLLTPGKCELPGHVRAGVWYDTDPKRKLRVVPLPAAAAAGGTMWIPSSEREEWGFYLNGDQLVWKEQAERGSRQGLGVFWRYGHRCGDAAPIEDFWSAGAQYEGLIPGRDRDVTGFGVAQALLPDRGVFHHSQETAYEWYYTARLMPWLTVGTSLQYIQNPGGQEGVGDAFVMAFRMRVTF